MFIINCCKQFRDSLTVEKIIYFIVMAAFIGNGFISLDIGIMHINLYRLSLIIIILYLLLNKTILKEQDFNMKIKNDQNTIVKFYLFWFTYGIVSLIWVQDIKLAIRALFFLGSGLFSIWMFTTFIREKKDFKIIFNIMFVMIILHNILGWFELITTRYLFIDIKKVDLFDRFSYNIASRRPISVFSNINDYATLMTFGVFISYIILLNAKELWVKILSSTTMISCIILISRSRSRANMLGLIIGFIGIAMLILYKRAGKRILFVMGIILFLVLALNSNLVTVIFTVIDDKILNTFKEGATSNKSNTIRINLIKNGFVFLRDTYGFGTGAGNIEYWMRTKQVFNVNEVYNIHNWWLEILVGYGLFVFVGYIYVYYIKTKTFLKAYLESVDPFIKNTALSLFGFMVAYTVSSASSSSNIDMEWIWLVWGVIISFVGYIIRDFKRLEEKGKEF